MSDETVDITIIGAGPVGLATAFWAGMRQASCRIIDSLPEIGGQCTTLYPEKWIFDVPGHPRILASELVEQLRAPGDRAVRRPGPPRVHRPRGSNTTATRSSCTPTTASCARAR